MTSEEVLPPLVQLKWVLLYLYIQQFLNFFSFRLTESNLNPEGSSFSCPNNKPAINLVVNVPPKQPNGKNANSSTDNKPIQKVKKTYIWYGRCDCYQYCLRVCLLNDFHDTFYTNTDTILMTLRLKTALRVVMYSRECL